MKKFLHITLPILLLCVLSLFLYSCGNGAAYSSDDDTDSDYINTTVYGSGYINVKNPKFGAMGDGITDDTFAIQKAIDSATGGNTVFFPAGSYIISSTLRISANGVHLKGQGTGATTIYNTSTNLDSFYFGGNTQQVMKCSISDMSISSTVSKTSGAAIRFGSDTIDIRNCYAYNLDINGHYDGIVLNNTTTVYLHDIILTSGGIHGTGIYISGGNDHYLNRVSLWNYSVNIGIYSTGATWIDNVDAMVADTNGLEIKASNGDITWSWISNSAFDSSGSNGIYISSSGNQVRGLNFSNVWASTNGTNGIYISGNGNIDGIQFIGARIFNNKANGVSVTSGKNITIDTSHISGNTGDGIIFSSNVSEFSVRNCRIGPMAGFSDIQQNGIYVEGTSSNHYIILGNDLRGNSVGLLNNSQGAVDSVVSNNLNGQ